MSNFSQITENNLQEYKILKKLKKLLKKNNLQNSLQGTHVYACDLQSLWRAVPVALPEAHPLALLFVPRRRRSHRNAENERCAGAAAHALPCISSVPPSNDIHPRTA